MTLPLDSAIDYGRFASLPMGVLPVGAAAAARAAYFRGFGLDCEFLAYGLIAPANFKDRPPDPDEPLAPQFNNTEWMRVRLAGAGRVLVPRTVRVVDPASQTTRVALPKATVENARSTWKTAAVLDAADDDDAVALKVGRTMVFDAQAAKASGLPIPFHPDESLVLFWPTSAAAPAPRSPALTGVVDLNVTAAGAVSVANLNPTAGATHLISTPANTWYGEFDPLLLRAPVFGALRFERYRHVIHAGATLTLANPSAVGRLVVRGFDRDAAGPRPADPLMLGKQIFVFENVARDWAMALLTAILAHQAFQLSATVASGGDLVRRPAAKKIASEHLTTLFRAWFAYERHFGLIPAGFGKAASDLKNVADAGLTKCGEICTALTQIEPGSARFLDFLRTVYVPLVCGGSWAELGIPLPVPAAREPRKSDPVDHAVLAELPRSSKTWTLVYAGCPIGRPARAYALGPAASPAAHVRDGYGTFDVEALHLAGLANALFGVAAAAPADPLAEIDLGPFAANSTGRYATFRVVEQHSFQASYGRVQQFTTRDWLLSATRGTTRRFFEPPLVDLRPDASAPVAAERHPLARMVGWDEFQAAKAMRVLMDDAHTRTVGAAPLASASLSWWVTRSGTGKVVGGVTTWPAFTPTGGNTRTRPSPRLPFAPSRTAGRGAIADSATKGLDYFDFEAVRGALMAVRDGADFGPIHPSLPLALAEREGYWTTILRDRVGNFVPGLVTRGAFSAGYADRPDTRRALAGAEWLLFPFGLDLLINRVARNRTPTMPSSAWVDSVLSQFDTVIGLLTTRADPLNPTTSILNPAVLPRSLVRDYLERALEIRWAAGAAARDELRVLSRRTQWIGLALQLAVFQLVHRLIRTGTAFPTDPGAAAHITPAEFTGAAPTWSAGANSAARRDYVVYYTLVYLAFNTSARTFNLWVTAANTEIAARLAANPGLPSDTVSKLLVLWKNSTSDAIQPLGATNRLLGQRGNMMRFAAALDAYARLDFDNNTVEVDDPAARNADPEWQLSGGP